MIAKKLRYLICLWLFLSVVIMRSQVPGYMGSRLSVGYGFYFNPALAAVASGKAPSLFNTENEGYIEYVTAPKFSFGLSARFYNTTSGNTRAVDVFSNYNSVYTQMDQNPSGSIDLNCLNLMIYGKSFYGNYLAPWGKYLIFGLTLNSIKAAYNPSDMKVKVHYSQYGQEYDYYYTDFGPTEQVFKKLDIVLGVGKTRIIGEHFTIDYGYNINLIAAALTLHDSHDDKVIGDGNLSAAEYIQKTAESRVRGINRFNLFLKFGILF